MKTKSKKVEYLHCFTDDKDVYFSITELGKTKALKLAKNQIKAWQEEGFENLRIYEGVEIDGELESEDCILSKGNYPY